jgi:hypothetical protein
MTEFEPLETTHEGHLYKRIGALETELIAAHQRINDLEREADLWRDRTKSTVKLLIISLVMGFIVTAALFIAACYLVFW